MTKDQQIKKLTEDLERSRESTNMYAAWYQKERAKVAELEKPEKERKAKEEAEAQKAKREAISWVVEPTKDYVDVTLYRGEGMYKRKVQTERRYWSIWRTKRAAIETTKGLLLELEKLKEPK
jgi:hypothetical protein